MIEIGTLTSFLSRQGRGCLIRSELCIFQLPYDHLTNRVWLFQYFMIPDSQYSKALRLQPSRPRFIVRFLFLFVVLPPVQFNDESAFQTNEIYNERPKRLLSAKLISSDLARPEHAPQSTFGIGGIFPQLFRSDCSHYQSLAPPNRSRPTITNTALSYRYPFSR